MQIFTKHRYRILIAITLMFSFGYCDNHKYPGPKFKTVKECGSVQMRQVIKHDVQVDGGYYTEEIPTLTVKFLNTIEKVEVPIDTYNKLQLGSSYCRFLTIEKELPILHTYLVALIIMCLLWTAIEFFHGLSCLDDNL